MQSGPVAAASLQSGRGVARSRWRQRGLLLAAACLAFVLAICAVFLCEAQSASSSRRAGNFGAAAIARLHSLPLQAQSVISATLSSGVSAFASTHLGSGYRLDGGGVRADLGGDGVLLRSASGSLSMRLSGIGAGSRMNAIGPVSLLAHANRVTYADAGLREWYAAGPLGIEQGFAIKKRPAGGSGPLTLALSLGGSLRAEPSGSQVHFVTGSGRVSLRYGALVATDASGRRLHAVLAVRGDTLLLRIADRGADYPLRIDPFIQQGEKLVGDCTSNCANEGTGESGSGGFGSSVALSAEGNTVLIGAPTDNSGAGAAWVFTRSGSTWSQQGEKLVGDCTSSCADEGTGESGSGHFGSSVALSADGDTALIGGLADNGDAGAVWVFTRSGSTWGQQGEKLVGDCTSSCDNEGTGESGEADFGWSVALSAEGDTALIGGVYDSYEMGAAWVFTRSGSTWSQQGEKLVGDCTSNCANEGTGESSSGPQAGEFGHSVALSADGNTALIGGPYDNGLAGATWVFTRSGSTWTQQGEKLVGDCTSSCANEGTGENGSGHFGSSVALSAEGDTALIGATADNGSAGAAWVFTRSGSTWSQQGEKLVGDCTSSCANEGTGESAPGFFGSTVALSAEGDTALIGGPYNSSGVGAAWLFTRSGSTWSQQGEKLVGDCTSSCADEGAGESDNALFGGIVALSADGDTALIGGESDDYPEGAAWVFTITAETSQEKEAAAKKHEEEEAAAKKHEEEVAAKKKAEEEATAAKKKHEEAAKKRSKRPNRAQKLARALKRCKKKPKKKRAVCEAKAKKKYGAKAKKRKKSKKTKK